jgi:protein TonB
LKKYILLSLLAHVAGAVVFSLDLRGFQSPDVPFFVDIAMASPEGAGSGAGGSMSPGPGTARSRKAANGSGGAVKAVLPAAAPNVEPGAEPAPRRSGERPGEAEVAPLEDPFAAASSAVSSPEGVPDGTGSATAPAEPAAGGGPKGGGAGAYAARGGGSGKGAGGSGTGDGAGAGGGTSGYGTGGDVAFGSARGPSFLERAVPAYPFIARRLGREGKVLLRLTIDERGTLAKVEVLEDPGYGFAAAAAEAAGKSRYAPAFLNGRPVAVRALLPVRFVLKGGG